MNEDVDKLIENEVKGQKGVFFSMLAATLGTNILANILAGKRVKAKIPEQEVIRAGEGNIGVGKDFYCHLIL